MPEVLVNYPGMGSLWLSDARIEGEFVVGTTWEDNGVGGHEQVLMNFPVTCIRKWVEQ